MTTMSMRTCGVCSAQFDLSLRRCPRCGAFVEAPASGSEDGLSGPKRKLGKVKIRTPGARLKLGAAVVLLALGGLVVVMGLPGSAPEPEPRSDDPVRVTKDPKRKPSKMRPDPKKARQPFEFTSVTWDDGSLLVEGVCSPFEVVEVRVNGTPAVISPNGGWFSARVDGNAATLEAVANGLKGEVARRTKELPARPADAAWSIVLSRAEGETVHDSSASIRWRLLESVGERTDTSTLTRLQNRIQLPGRRFVLYRAPKGLVYLRTTPNGHRTFLRVKDGTEMVLVPTGVARRGDPELPDASPQQVVTTSAFLIDRSEVTCRQFSLFLRFMASTDDPSVRHPADPGDRLRPAGWVGTDPPPGAADQPVRGVSWYAAFAYARWVGGRLPSEAEWERAGAGPQGLPYPWGRSFDKEACRCDGAEPWNAVSLLAGEGPFGLLHMSGNVREWCNDRFDPRWYDRSVKMDPVGPVHGQHRVVRGGSFQSERGALRLQARQHLLPTERASDVGFRVAWTYDPPR